MNRYTIISKKIKKNFNATKLTLSVENMKAIDFVMVRPFLRIYDSANRTLGTAYGDWWSIGNIKEKCSKTFTITQTNLEKTAWYTIGFIIDGVTHTNRLLFNHIQLCEGESTMYHQPATAIPKTEIKFTSNFYANFYTNDEKTYLQVIRPYYNSMDTKTITKSKVTVLAPHLADEDDVDDPNNIGLEYMNMSEQVIEILR